MGSPLRFFLVEYAADGEQRRKHGGDDRHELDENVDGRTGGILEGITDRIADDSSLVSLRALAAVSRRSWT